jgi:hypothetical protein
LFSCCAFLLRVNQVHPPPPPVHIKLPWGHLLWPAGLPKAIR